ncbi:NUDIX hydrolase [Yoonia sp. 2307UL14-13]|uniref:NUDIX hydrolase n=1 Tax=Yoonia sp. 2307UL14-13 TaxID=3126506 RepID=UPI0030A06B78
MIRRYGDAPQNGHRYVLRPGAYAILPRDGRLLLTYQAEPHCEVQLPGGGIDPGESPVQALHREVFEETGWRIAAPRRVGVFRRFVYMPEYGINAEKVCHIYAAHPVRAHGAPTEEGHMAIWLTPQDAMGELYNAGDVDFVRRLFG